MNLSRLICISLPIQAACIFSSLRTSTICCPFANRLTDNIWTKELLINITCLNRIEFSE